jgi:hypothetical protein
LARGSGFGALGKNFIIVRNAQHRIFGLRFGYLIRATTSFFCALTPPATAGAVRSWTRIDDFVREVANARIYDGVHYRNSTEVGIAMGQKIGALAAAKYLRR